jgi:PilZ domain
MSVPKERRRHTRTVVAWPVTVITPQTQVEGQIENISPVGAFISFAESPPLEWNFRMLIKPPKHQTINVVAKVIWSTVLSTGEGAPRFGVGVEFTRISEGDRQFLEGNPE